MREFDLIVFDWDGTLMDSEARILACMRAAAVDLELAVPADENIRGIIGLGLYEAVSALFPQLDNTDRQRGVEAYRHHYLVEDKTPSPLFARAAETVSWLESQGYLLAVATGKGRQGLDAVLDSSGLRSCFQTTRCADEAFSKPHPDMLEQIIGELGVESGKVLMVGDTDYDLLMAHNAGTSALAVSYGVHPLERLLAQNPLGCLDDIGELIAWLQQRNGMGHASIL